MRECIHCNKCLVHVIGKNTCPTVDLASNNHGSRPTNHPPAHAGPRVPVFSHMATLKHMLHSLHSERCRSGSVFTGSYNVNRTSFFLYDMCGIIFFPLDATRVCDTNESSLLVIFRCTPTRRRPICFRILGRPENCCQGWIALRRCSCVLKFWHQFRYIDDSVLSAAT